MYKLSKYEQQTLKRAERILTRIMENTPLYKGELTVTEPGAAVRFLRAKLAWEEREQFVVMFLDNQHCLIECRTMFSGTINVANIYPREIVKAALELNAAAIIISHNHPSGLAEPSYADKLITQKIKEAMALVEIRVLDHIIISSYEQYCFSENNLL